MIYSPIPLGRLIFQCFFGIEKMLPAIFTHYRVTQFD
jgi:hypothetical protein